MGTLFIFGAGWQLKSSTPENWKQRCGGPFKKANKPCGVRSSNYSREVQQQ